MKAINDRLRGAANDLIATLFHRRMVAGGCSLGLQYPADELTVPENATIQR